MGDEKAAPVSKDKKVKTKEKKQRTGRKHESLKVWNYYEVKGDTLVRKKKYCPRCGAGTFLSEHKQREYCGRCGFTQLEKKGAPEAATEQKEEAPAQEKEETAAQENEEPKAEGEAGEQAEEKEEEEPEKKPKESPPEAPKEASEEA